ncbi:MAG: CHAT domain-containing protein, partial [Candidatus Eisenbacteria sp.]|nr:CHAT domain-containing protein [Candidatus Eisenbacteria bacterium]
PAVQLRAEPPGMISVVIAGSRDAVARDSVVERNALEERRVVEAFHALAQRSASFAGASEGGGWSRAQIDDAQRELYALGLAIGGALLGGSREVADALVDLPGDHLQLGVQTELSGIPWELLVARTGGEYLWQLFSVTRQLRDSAGVRPCPARRGGRCRLLLLANPAAGGSGRELQAVEREAADLLELGATRPDLLRVVRKSPRSADELRQLLAEGFDVLHFAGHTGNAMGLERGWVLADGNPVSPAELFSNGVPAPTLVFANACNSNPSARGESVADAARALMLAGVPAYLCTVAELHDAGSAAFSVAFYRAVLSGATLGSAVTAARTALFGRHPITWANYVLYGDPALILCGSPSAHPLAKKLGPSSD